MAKLATVNVIKIHDGSVELVAFPDDNDGSHTAELVFVSFATDDPKWGEWEPEEVDAILNEGHYEWDSAALFLVHSNTG